MCFCSISISLLRKHAHPLWFACVLHLHALEATPFNWQHESILFYDHKCKEKNDDRTKRFWLSHFIDARNENQCNMVVVRVCGLNWGLRVQTETQTQTWIQTQTETSKDIRFFYCRNKLLLFTGRVLFCRYSDIYRFIQFVWCVYVRSARFFISLFQPFISMCVMLLPGFYISIFSSHCLFCFLSVCMSMVWYVALWLLYDAVVSQVSFCLCAIHTYESKIDLRHRICSIANCVQCTCIEETFAPINILPRIGFYHYSMEQWHFIGALLYFCR